LCLEKTGRQYYILERNNTKFLFLQRTINFTDSIKTLKYNEPVEIVIDGVLDLHTFRPGEVKDLVPEYIRECRSRGIRDIRIIHGKGSGTLRAIVHSILKKERHVKSFSIANEDGGGWGATLVRLR
jgi:dsDNA-specific endonuclease/ATPase MutS2